MIRVQDNSPPVLEEYRMIVGAFNKAVTTMLSREAWMLANNIKGGLIAQRPGGKKIRPISRTTILLRGIRTGGGSSTKALIDTAAMVNAVKPKRENMYHYTVGVHRTARSKKGKKLADLAAIHEGGTKTYTVVVTEKMRRFSFVLMKYGILRAPWRVGQKLRRRIPARPWLNPAHDEWIKGSEERFVSGLAAMLGVSM